MNLYIFDKTPHIACSFYRGWGPIKNINRNDQSIQITPVHSVPLLTQQAENWHIFEGADVVFTERPVNYEYFSACTMAKSAGAKLWIDFDDDFTSIPDYNPFSKVYNNKNSREILEKSCELADVITVTTDGLRDVYRKFNKNVHVIPNAFNDYRFKLEYKFSDNKIINWRGSTTHRGDLLPLLDDIWKLSRENESWEWSFIGNDISWLTDGMRPGEGIQKKKLAPELYQSYYWKYIKDIAPGVQIVPLTDNQFNRGKSMCAWIEATYSGAATVAPDFGDFKRPGIINYRDFSETLKAVIDDEDLRREKYTESFDYINDNLLLSKVNEKRLEILRGLI